MTIPVSTEQNHWVSWSAYHTLIEQLALQIYESGWTFDQILCLARGGLRVGDVLSRIFDKPLAILTTSSYRAAAGTLQGRLDIAQYVTMTSDRLAGRVLLVDDLVDSGVTLVEVLANLQERFSEISEIRTGVLWYKGHSCVIPDFYVQKLDSNPWIHQPFEDYDVLDPALLAAKVRAQSRS
jgi:hypoxanthine phosphoribosyltransferase